MPLNRNGIAAEGVLRTSGPALLRQARGQIYFRGFAGLFSRRIERPRRILKGHLLMSEAGFTFAGTNDSVSFSYDQLTCITTNSRYFEFKVAGRSFFQIRFREESALKYELLFRQVLGQFYSRRGKTIVEFQPCIRFAGDHEKCHRFLQPGVNREVKKVKLSEPAAAVALRFILKGMLRLLAKIRVQGLENVPSGFPFVAVLNHQSLLDPFIILSFVHHSIAFLTKSTSFVNPVERCFLRIGRGIPTTRYKTDPLVIRHILMFLQHDIPVGIFPEGERSWDGRMAPFKLSVILFLCAARVPVLPVRMENTFLLLPRWRNFPRPQRLAISVSGSFCLVPGLYSIDALREFLEEIIRPQK
ncbi:MAG: lysophospholipid acyltransferase family protein [Calditrichia bacterium]